MTSLAEAASPDVRGGGALLVPVGATEQHGPHLPLGTDTLIIEALVRRFEIDRPHVWVSPAVAIGASGEHAGFPGTLSIGRDVLTTLLVELGRSADSFDRLYFANWHGGNVAAIAGAVDRLNEEGRRASQWRPKPVSDEHDLHAGRIETSMMLAIRPDLVRTDVAARGETGRSLDILARLRSEGVMAVSDNGVLGDPEGASLAEGHQLLKEYAGQLVAEFDRFVLFGQ